MGADLGRVMAIDSVSGGPGSTLRADRDDSGERGD